MTDAKPASKAELQIDELYKAYPKHVAPRRAKQQIGLAIHRLRQDGLSEPYEYLMMRVRQYAESPAGQPPAGGPDYRPYPAIWFNGARYDDDQTEWQRRNGRPCQPEPASEILTADRQS